MPSDRCSFCNEAIVGTAFTSKSLHQARCLKNDTVIFKLEDKKEIVHYRQADGKFYCGCVSSQNKTSGHQSKTCKRSFEGVSKFREHLKKVKKKKFWKNYKPLPKWQPELLSAPSCMYLSYLSHFIYSKTDIISASESDGIPVATDSQERPQSHSPEHFSLVSVGRLK